MRISGTGNGSPFRPALTLIELVVVLAILAVAAGVIIPRVGRSLEHHELEQAAGNFAHLARTVRELAAAQQKTFVLGLDMDRGTYNVGVVSDTNAKDIQKVHASWIKGGRWPEGVKLSDFKTPDSAPAHGGSQEIRFRPDGTSTGASMRLVCRERMRLLVIRPHNGRVDNLEATAKTDDNEQMDLGD